jgi:uncharacterized membrane protein
MQAQPGYPGPVLDARPRFGEWMSEAFTLFGREWITWVLITLVYSVVVGIPAVVLVTIGVFIAVALGMGASAAGGDSSGPAIGAILAMGVFSLLAVVVTLAFVAYMLAGFTRAAIRQLRGEKIGVGDLFSGGDVLLPVVVVDVLRALGVLLGYLLCFIPGLVVGTLWQFAHPLVVERRLTPGEAMKTSWDTVKPHVWMYLVWLLLVGLIAGAGGAIGIGYLATYPIAHLMMVISYRDVFGIPGAVPTAAPGMPGQPVGGYGAPVPPQAPPASPYGTQPSPYSPTPPPGP